jgi:hypothetical protein
MKKNVLKAGIAILVMLLFSVGVMAQDGNKNVITQTRNVATFDGLSVSGIFKVIYTQGEPQSVKIETDENLMGQVITEVHGGILEIGTKGNIHNITKMIAYVTSKNLNFLGMSGATKFTATNKIVVSKLTTELSGTAKATFSANVPNIICRLSGTAKLDLEGLGEKLSADISGTAKLAAEKFDVKDAKVDASGVGTATINATKTLYMNASGVSKIKYTPHENLDIKNQEISGMAHISK